MATGRGHRFRLFFRSKIPARPSLHAFGSGCAGVSTLSGGIGLKRQQPAAEKATGPDRFNLASRCGLA